MTSKEEDTVIEAVRLIAEHGRDASELIVSAVKRGWITLDQLDETVAQLEDLPGLLPAGAR